MWLRRGKALPALVEERAARAAAGGRPVLTYNTLSFTQCSLLGAYISSPSTRASLLGWYALLPTGGRFAAAVRGF